MLNVSCCMIVKDEEKNILRCIGSIINKVKEVIVVDTGCTDNTIKIMKEQFPSVKVFYRKWDNSFANARNFSISKAKGKWIFYMDADEEFVGEFPENPTKNIWNFNIRNINDQGNFVVSQCSRLIPNMKGLKFKGDMHEIFAPPVDMPIMLMDEKQCHIVHYGYTSQMREEKKKSERNTELLEKQYKEKSTVQNCYYLGQEMFIANNIERARKLALEGIEKYDPNNTLDQTFRPLLWHLLVSCANKDDSLEKVREFEEVVPKDVLHPEIHASLIDFYTRHKITEKVLEHTTRCISLANYPRPAKCVEGSTSTVPALMCANYLIQNKEYAMALMYFEFAYNSGNRDVGVMKNIYGLMPKIPENVDKCINILKDIIKHTNEKQYMLELSNYYLNSQDIGIQQVGYEILKQHLEPEKLKDIEAKLKANGKGYLINELDQKAGQYKVKKSENLPENSLTVVIPTMLKMEKTYLHHNLNVCTASKYVKEIIVIDNSGGQFEKDFVLNDKIKVVVNKENVGVNPAWNQGLELVTTPYYLILNDDCLVRGKVLESCVNGIYNIKDTGMIAVHTMNEPIEKYSMSEVNNYEDVFMVFNGLGRNTNGWFMFGKKEEWIAIPEELNIFYGDDFIHWCARMRDKKVLKLISNYVSHFTSSTVRALGIYDTDSLKEEGKKFEKIKKEYSKMFKEK